MMTEGVVPLLLGMVGSVGNFAVPGDVESGCAGVIGVVQKIVGGSPFYW